MPNLASKERLAGETFMQNALKRLINGHAGHLEQTLLALANTRGLGFEIVIFISMNPKPLPFAIALLRRQRMQRPLRMSTIPSIMGLVKFQTADAGVQVRVSGQI